MGIYAKDVQKLYIAYFNRPADVLGLAYWEDQVAKNGGSTAAVANAFSASQEYKDLYAGKSSAQIVDAIYQNLFGRAAEPAGLTYWGTRLDNGTFNIGNIAISVMTGAQNDDKTTIDNKTTAADTFTTNLDTSAEIIAYSGTAANAVAKAWLATVTSAASTLTAATASVNSTITSISAGTVANGTTFTLTTASDNVTGTANNDTINASLAYASGSTAVDTTSTLSVADIIAGGSGTDTLNVTITGGNAGTTFAAASITGVETLNLRNVSGQTNSLDASTISGLTSINADRATSTVTVTNIASGAAAGMIGDGTVVTGAFNAGYAAAATASTLNISGGTATGSGAITVTGAGVTSATINSTGAANTVGAVTLAATTAATTINATTNLTTGALTNAGATLTVTGAGAVNLSTTALEAGVTKIDASANTGGLTAKLSSAANISVTGSAGNDVFTTNAVLTTGSVNAGSGTDTLDLGTNVAHANTTSLAAKYTGFETLRVNGTFDASLISSITAVQLSGATNAITNMTATQAAAVTARADIGASTLTLATASGTSDVLSLTMGAGGTGTGAATNAGVLTITGFETLNLATAHGSTATTGANRTSTITGAIVDTSLTKINLTGSAFTFTDIATTKAVTIDGSALVGDGATTAIGLTVAGSATAGSTITGSNVKDQFTIGAEGSTYNAGSGNDTITTTAAILAADGTTDVTVAGGAGTDTLAITGTLTLTDNNFTNVTGMEKLDLTSGTTTVSVTGLGAAAKAAFADGLTITSGTLADGATYTLGAGLYDKAVTVTLVSSGDGASTADNIAITTGSAADTVTVTAASWTGATGGAAGTLTVSTGAGNDTISVTTGTILAETVTAPVTITGGTGADTITAVGTNAASGLTVTFAIAAGDSTTTAYDSITGFDMGTGALFSSTLDFATVALNAYAATAATGSTAAELTVAVSAAGVVTFAGTKASALTLAEKIAAVQSVVTTTNGDTALFTHGSNTYVFNNNTTADSVVELVGITGTSLVTANATTAGAIFIA
jgi:hypothetical protein